MLLFLKLILAPALIGLASLLMARLGARLGGILTALPVVTGPVLLLFALEQGPEFAAAAASRTLLGTVSLLAYTTAYVRFAQCRSKWAGPWSALLIGWGSFFVASRALLLFALPKATAIVLAVGAILLALWSFPRMDVSGPAQSPPAPTVRMLGVRMGSAALMVWSLSEVAARLGSAWSGMLSAFPVVSTVMLVATHRSNGLATAVTYLRGFYLGLFGYVAFIVCIAYLLVPWGLGIAFGLGITAAMATQAGLTWAPSQRPLEP